MPKYYCDYCDTYLTHDSPSVRKTHNLGRNHKENVRLYYQQWMEEQAQKLIDQTTAAFKSGKIPRANVPCSMNRPMAPFLMPPSSPSPFFISQVQLGSNQPLPTNNVPFMVPMRPPMFPPNCIPQMGQPVNFNFNIPPAPTNTPQPQNYVQ